MTHNCSDLTQHPDIRHEQVTILENIAVGDATFRLRFSALKLAKSCRPGQFVMLRLTESDDPLLGRPLAVYRVDHESGDVEVVYAVVGKMTKKLSQLTPGTKLMVWGPLGNGFAIPDAKHLVMVAGGIGQTPFFSLAKQAKLQYETVSLLFGAQTREKLCCLDDFRNLGIDVQVTTEDGSEGIKGLVTTLLNSLLEKKEFQPSDTVIVSCGPKKMLEAVFKQSRAHGNYPCYVSLESPMACGLGICFSCVVKHKKDDGTYDYLRTCVDGPVFDASRLEWDFE